MSPRSLSMSLGSSAQTSRMRIPVPYVVKITARYFTDSMASKRRTVSLPLRGDLNA